MDEIGGRNSNGTFAPGNRIGFQPGQSGNPSGRAKGLRSICWQVRQRVAEEPRIVGGLLDRIAAGERGAAAELSQLARVHDGRDGGVALDAEAQALEERLREEQEGPVRHRKPMEALQLSLAVLRTAGVHNAAQAVQEELLELRRREDGERRSGPT